ncbi:MAG: tRNA (N(6)-L-threonylcarbamoyladenosine(37)-C(2))-methylthiotransferase MtaB [Firmicutes bacterium]|nr:tRNA (N(6)-L-threonylcarbamoyladenosine(37)-C(2))-methylthiotransferase MtaB [Bacillota bacterium]
MAFHTLGCKVNQYDTASVASLFKERGYAVVDFDAPAEVYVINTCCVTHLADRKSRQAVRRARRQNPGARVVMMGCSPQVDPVAAAAVSGVDLVVGTADRGRLADLLEQVPAVREPDLPPMVSVGKILAARDFEDLPAGESPSGRTRAYVKVQDGCSRFCSYCVIPRARGIERSRTPRSVIEEVRVLARTGYREIVLTGVLLSAYGKELAPPLDLAGLLELVHEVEGIERIRLSSVQPGDVDDRLLAALAELPKVCPHLHLPLQSGADEILRAMRRPYDTRVYRAVLDMIRDRRPEIAVTADVIVGFPGETETLFQEGARFIEAASFSGMHIFPFSPRRGTPAFSLPGRPGGADVQRRIRELERIAAAGRSVYAERFLGRVQPVLVEEPAGEGLLQGYTPHYLKVVFPGADPVRGATVPVFLEELRDECLLGRPVAGNDHPADPGEELQPII